MNDQTTLDDGLGQELELAAYAQANADLRNQLRQALSCVAMFEEILNKFDCHTVDGTDEVTGEPYNLNIDDPMFGYKMLSVGNSMLSCLRYILNIN